MWRFVCVMLASSCALVSPLWAEEGDMALIGATLIDGSGAPPLADAAIVIRGDRIVAVGPRDEVTIPRDARVVDVAGRWITPGLIDAHVHFFQSGGLYTRPDAIDLRQVVPYESELGRTKAQLEATFARYVASGVTAVVDFGGPLWNFDVRDHARDSAPAPRVSVAGPLIATSPRPSIGALDLGDPPIIYAESVEMARALAIAQLERRPDFIKVWGIGSDSAASSRIRSITEAVVAVAHPRGVRVAVHATELEHARAAVAGGADILVHGVGDQPVDQDFIDALRDRGVVYVTTLVVFEGFRDLALGRPDYSIIERSLGDPVAIASLYETPAEQLIQGRRAIIEQRVQQMQENVVRLVRGGARVAAGTDAGNPGTLHGPALHRELQLLVEAGLTPMEALSAATRDASFAYAVRPSVGRVTRGALADLLVLAADPLADIGNLAQIERVYSRGVAYDPWAILAPSPEAVVQRQLEPSTFTILTASSLPTPKTPNFLPFQTRPRQFSAAAPRYATVMVLGCHHCLKPAVGW